MELPSGRKISHRCGKKPSPQRHRDHRENMVLPFHGSELILYPALVGAGNAHVFPVLRNRAASDLNALRLKNVGDLLVGQRVGGVLLFDELLDAALEDEQRGAAAFGAVDALGEEVTQFENALRGVSVLVGYGAADGGRVHADLFRHFLDHHGLEVVDALVEEFTPASADGGAHAQNGLLALLDVLDELHGRLVTLFDVVAPVFFGGVALQQTAVGRIEAQLRDFFVVHDDDELFTVLDEGDVGLDETGLNLVVAQAGTRIESADEVEGGGHGLERTAHGFSDVLVVLVLEGGQVLVHHDDGGLDGFVLSEDVGGAVLALDGLEVTELA